MKIFYVTNRLGFKLVVYLLMLGLCSSWWAMPKANISKAAPKIFINKAVPKDARLVVSATYSEVDKFYRVKKTVDGEEITSWEHRILANFFDSEKQLYRTDSEGEHFNIIENPQRNYTASYQETYREDTIDRGRNKLPTKIFRRESAKNGTLDPKSVGASVDYSSRGFSVDFHIAFPMVSGCNGYTSTWINKGTIENPQFAEEKIPQNNCGRVPEDKVPGGFSANAKPNLPSPSPGEDPGLTIERQQLENPLMVWSGDWYGAQTVKSKNGYTVSFSKTKEDPQAKEESAQSTPDEKIKHTHTKTLSVKATLIIGEPPPAEMEIEAEKTADYDAWMPVPASDDEKIKDLYGEAKTVTFRAFFKSKDPKKPAPAAPIDFYLQDVSKHKGRSGNEPADADNDSDLPDLRFAKNQPNGVIVDISNPQHAYVIDDVPEATVAVEATDAGAYGKLIARSDEMGLLAVYQRTGQNFVPLPRDDNNNHIADVWEKNQKIFEKNYPANWDEEDTPQGYNKGDGLTLYEEYRGFVLETEVGQTRFPQWKRLPPTLKKIFVNVTGTDQELYRQGVKGFEKASLLTAYFLPSDKYLKTVDDQQPRVEPAGGGVPEIRYPDLPPRWLNFNSDTNDGIDYGQRQFAINIIPWKLPQEPNVYARTTGIQGVSNFDPAPPELTQAVYVFRENGENIIANFVNAEFPKGHPEKIDKSWYPVREKILATRGINIDLAKVNDYANLHYGELVNRMIIFNIIHELSHATGMLHHTLQEYVDEIAASIKKNGVKDFSELPEPERKRLKAILNFSSGDKDCPMFYWDKDDFADFQLLFYSGNWNPAETAASGKPWKFDNGKDCMQSCRLKKDK